MKLRTPRTNQKIKGISPDVQGTPTPQKNTKTIKVRDLPWYNLFKDHGYSDNNIPTTNPPQPHLYGEILTWLSRDEWIIEKDEDLAMEIWLGRASLFDYKANIQQSKTETPTQTAPTNGKRVSRIRLNKNSDAAPKSFET